MTLRTLGGGETFPIQGLQSSPVLNKERGQQTLATPMHCEAGFKTRRAKGKEIMASEASEVFGAAQRNSFANVANFNIKSA